MNLHLITAAVPLFGLGAWLAYVTLDEGLDLHRPGPGRYDGVESASTDYLGYATAMLLIFGLTFSFALRGDPQRRRGADARPDRKSRRMLIFGIFVFAAVATPSQDPFTMLALALPTVFLFEVAEVIAWISRQAQGLHGPTRTRACPTTRRRPRIPRLDDMDDDLDGMEDIRPPPDVSAVTEGACRSSVPFRRLRV